MDWGSIEVADVKVVVRRVDRLSYWLKWAAAVPLSLLLWDDQGNLAPRKSYEVRVVTSGGRTLWEELAFDLDAADRAQEFAEQIGRIGIKDFLFKKEHGWRID